MRNRIKSYLVFTGVWYRLAVYLLMPAALIGTGLWIEGNLEGNGAGAGVIIAAVLLPVTEIISDNWLFGGIQTKDSMRLGYLKTSGRGMGILRSALWMDLVRKFLWALGVIFLTWLAGGWIAGDGIGILLYFALVSYTVSTFGTFLSRFSAMLWVNLLIAYGSLFLVALSIVMLILVEYMLLIDIICTIIGVAVSIVAVEVAMKRVERSYYDK